MFMAEKGITGITLVPVDLNQGEHFSAAFRTKSPQAKVPALELDDGRVLTETRAICSYLEGLYPETNLMGVGFDEHAFIEMADRRVEWTLLLGIANGVRHTHPGLAPLESPQFADFGRSQTDKVKEAAKVFDQLLQHQEWMAGPRFTIADITAFCSLEFGRALLKFTPADLGLHALQAWRDRMAARPSAKVV
jgi:glutathione S-transferase